MSKPKWTPGPWQVMDDPENNVIGRHILQSIWAGADDGPSRPGHTQIAILAYGGKGIDENSANARLIAAAPKLAEALERLLAVAERLAEHRDTCPFYAEIPVDGAECACGLLQAQDEARAALREAMGETTEVGR